MNFTTIITHQTPLIRLPFEIEKYLIEFTLNKSSCRPDHRVENTLTTTTQVTELRIKWKNSHPSTRRTINTLFNLGTHFIIQKVQDRKFLSNKRLTSIEVLYVKSPKGRWLLSSSFGHASWTALEFLVCGLRQNWWRQPLGFKKKKMTPNAPVLAPQVRWRSPMQGKVFLFVN